jgi:hypothetical protein
MTDQSVQLVKYPRTHHIQGSRFQPIVSVRVVLTGTISSAKRLARLVAPSQFIGAGHVEHLQALCEAQGIELVIENLRKNTIGKMSPSWCPAF